MADSQLPTPEELRQLLCYEPHTGRIFWQPRYRGFASERAMSAWNGRFAWKPAFTTIGNNGYCVGGIGGVKILAHRAILAMVNGVWPRHHVDHINGVRTDNRLANLRVATQVENNRNSKTPVTNSSGYVGVSWHEPSERWRVRIGNSHVGMFDDLSQAVIARAEAERKHGYHPNHGR